MQFVVAPPLHDLIVLFFNHIQSPANQWETSTVLSGYWIRSWRPKSASFISTMNSSYSMGNSPQNLVLLTARKCIRNWTSENNLIIHSQQRKFGNTLTTKGRGFVKQHCENLLMVLAQQSTPEFQILWFADRDINQMDHCKDKGYLLYKS